MAVTIADVGGTVCLVLAAVLVAMAVDFRVRSMRQLRREAAEVLPDPPPPAAGPELLASLAYESTPGTVTLPGAGIRLEDTSSIPRGIAQDIPLGTWSAAQLTGLGVPAALAQEIVADRRRFRLVEDRLEPGAFVNCVQDEPDGELVLLAGSVERIRLQLSGCLVAILLGGALVLLLLGISLIAG